MPSPAGTSAVEWREPQSTRVVIWLGVPGPAPSSAPHDADPDIVSELCPVPPATEVPHWPARPAAVAMSDPTAGPRTHATVAISDAIKILTVTPPRPPSTLRPSNLERSKKRLSTPKQWVSGSRPRLLYFRPTLMCARGPRHPREIETGRSSPPHSGRRDDRRKWH